MEPQHFDMHKPEAMDEPQAMDGPEAQTLCFTYCYISMTS